MTRFLLVLGLVCMFGLSGCGKVSAPYPDSGYPHTYPRR